MKTTESKEHLIEESLETLESTAASIILTDPASRPLGPIEKQFLLQAERGDCAGVRRLLREYKDNPEELDINCVDPLNRSALIAAVENENIDLIKLLLEEGIQVKDALLHAIKEEYVEGVELLLQYEEDHHKAGESYSWESIERSAATFTPDITPLILAAHKNNYEIIKILLDRGASLPMPHDIRCGCDECVDSINTDSLRHSQARINAYRALTASSLIALSSKDPVLTAFELSWELRNLSRIETEFRAQYQDMRSLVQEFATALLDYVRSSKELEIMLNYDSEGEPWEPGDHQSLDRLKLAIKYKQKMFVAHPTVQQLLASIWYEGLPGFRRKNLLGQLMQVSQMAIMFPVYCTIYMLAPSSPMGLFMKKPFVRFICHSSSYAFFLMLLGAASQRVEVLLLEWFGTESIQEMVREWKRKERGAGPGLAECGVILYVISLIWGEMKSLWDGGIMEYISDLWNIVDFITNMFYVMWLALRFSSIYIVWREANQGRDPWYPREQWDMFDPMLLSEGAFAAGMIFSFLKLVHIFSVNPHLGPLQISLGRMIIDIVKFFFIYTLVLFAFGCGLNQLLWYYAELEKNKCYHLPSGLPDFDNNDKACTIWRRYANLFETSQSLFWASFGLVDLVSFELSGIKGFTRFWALLMFGSYSVINVIVLLNMLIAMMSNSYQIISERADTEWKFARTRLWISYFDDGDTLPPPFNIFPTVKNATKIMSCGNKQKKEKRSKLTYKENHEAVMRLLVRRYITAQQRNRDEYGVTEDDILEIRQDVNSFRYELVDILRNNGMNVPKLSKDELDFTGKKGKVMERRLLKDFHIGIVEGIVSDVVTSMKEPKDVFTQIAKAMGRRKSSKDWNALVRRKTLVQDHIGSAQEAETARQNRQSLRKHIVTSIKESVAIDHEKLLEYNPKLSAVPPRARLAYAKFMSKKIEQEIISDDEEQRQKSKEVGRTSIKFTDQKTDARDETAAETKPSADNSTQSAIATPDDSTKSVSVEVTKRPLSPIVASPPLSDGATAKEPRKDASPETLPSLTLADHASPETLPSLKIEAEVKPPTRKSSIESKSKFSSHKKEIETEVKPPTRKSSIESKSKFSSHKKEIETIPEGESESNKLEAKPEEVKEGDDAGKSKEIVEVKIEAAPEAVPQGEDESPKVKTDQKIDEKKSNASKEVTLSVKTEPVSSRSDFGISGGSGSNIYFLKVLICHNCELPLSVCCLYRMDSGLIMFIFAKIRLMGYNLSSHLFFCNT
ncbi:Ankyrin repeats (3 copies) [Popillia japonica]|uniref:Ankyrin repeats (3 copies) n=1 Tax=Popillia japonica TaxID=7064 RepID=A0AAW1HU66_POPJA